MYLTRATAAVVAAVVSVKRVVVANDMKISKARLEQIIKEELTESDIFAEDMSLEVDDIEEFITGRMYYYDFEDVLGWLETQPYFEKRDLLAYLKTDPSSFRPYMYDNQKVERVSTEGLWNLVSGHILDQSTEKRGKELIKLLMIAIKHGREAEIMGDVFPEIKKITDTNRENFIKQTKADEEEAQINIKQMGEHKMKLTKQKLQKIIEEELQKLTVKEGSMGAGLGTHKCDQLEQKHKDVYADMSMDPTGQSGMFLGRIEDEAKKLKCPWAEKIREDSFDNLNEEDAIDYAQRQEGYEDKIFSMLVRNKMTKDPDRIEKLRRNQEMMDYLVKVMTRPNDPMNKRDPDFAAKAKDAFMKAFDNVVRNLESGEYDKKQDVPPESPEAKREREIAFGQAMARGDYGKLD